MNDAEIIEQTQKQIIEGHSKQDIIEFIKTTQKDGREQELLEAAIIKFSEQMDIGKEVKKGFACAAIQNLYKQMLGVGDFAGALGAIKEYSKLNRLYEKDIEKPNQIKEIKLIDKVDLWYEKNKTS